MARIYISSTYKDLADYREQVRVTVRREGHEAVAMEYYGARGEYPLDRCLRDVKQCDLYIGIFAWRYGFIPPKHDRSITELEYRKAVETKKECLIFLLSEDAPWPRIKQDKDLSRIEQLRAELSEKHTVVFFTNKDDLAARIGEAIRDWERRTGREPGGLRADWDAYKHAVFEKHRWVPLEVIAAKQDKIARIPLIKIFVPQICKPGYPSRDVPEEAMARQIQPLNEEWVGTSPEAILDVLGQDRTQVILGGPGSGKSTLLHYTLCLLCNQERPAEALPVNLKHAPVPFLIELRHYVLKKVANFVEFIVTEAKESYGITLDGESLEKLFSEDKQALVFFDGLDEVFDPAERRRVVEQFQAFAEQYQSVQIVVTSRIAGYEPAPLMLRDFQHYTLLDFTIQQIRQFIGGWYTYYTWEDNRRNADDLFKHITENRRLLELAGTPLLLAMMAVMYKNKDLPEKRWKLYERCVEVLLEDWDIKRKSLDRKTILPLDITIGADQKAKILQHVSMYMLESNHPGRELNAIDYEPLMAILARYLEEQYKKPPGEAETIAKEVLNHLRERTYILALTGKDIFGFVHRTFMEYFAACYCKAAFSRKKADYNWLITEIFQKHWQEEDWQEVLLLLIAMLTDQDWPVEEVLEAVRKSSPQAPALGVAFAARCLAEAMTMQYQELAQGLLIELAQAIAASAGRRRRGEGGFSDAALQAFSVLAPLVELPLAAQEEISRLERSGVFLERMVGWQMGLARRSRQERLRFALAALQDKKEKEQVRRGAIAALEREWSGNEEVWQELLAIVQNDHPRIRQAAIGALQRGWPTKAEAILSAIEERLERETSVQYMGWLVNHLAAHWQGEPQAWRLLRKISEWRKGKSGYGEVARRAIEAIALYWPGYPETYLLLREQAANNPSPDVRSACLQLLAQGWATHAETLNLLHRRAVKDLNADVRITALRMIAQGWPTDPNTLRLLRERAVQDPDAPVQGVARVLSP